MEQAVWLAFGVIAVIIGFAIVANLVTTNKDESRYIHFQESLEKLTRFDSVGKLANLKSSVSEARQMAQDRQVVTRTEALRDVITQLQPLTTYLAAAAGQLPDAHPWNELAAEKRQALVDSVREFAKGTADLNLIAERREAPVAAAGETGVGLESEELHPRIGDPPYLVARPVGRRIVDDHHPRLHAAAPDQGRPVGHHLLGPRPPPRRDRHAARPGQDQGRQGLAEGLEDRFDLMVFIGPFRLDVQVGFGCI